LKVIKKLKVIKLRLNILFLILSASLITCTNSFKLTKQNSSVSIDSTSISKSSIDSFIQPYKTVLDSEMNEVLVMSAEEFPKERGKPETKLGNLVVDLCHNYMGHKLSNNGKIEKPEMCILNFGGLRTSLPKGDITRGKIYELMPFENELVLVTINPEKFSDLVEYLKKVGGQPISGASFVFDEDSTQVLIENENKPEPNFYKVLTSDYLANGGDNMKFFLDPVKIEYSGVKIRDAIIEYCIYTNDKGEQLHSNLDGRIIFE